MARPSPPGIIADRCGARKSAPSKNAQRPAHASPTRAVLSAARPVAAFAAKIKWFSLVALVPEERAKGKNHAAIDHPVRVRVRLGKFREAAPAVETDGLLVLRMNVQGNERQPLRHRLPGLENQVFDDLRGVPLRRRDVRRLTLKGRLNTNGRDQADRLFR